MHNNDKQGWAERWVLKAGKKDFAVGKRAEIGLIVAAAMSASVLFYIVIFLILRRRPEIDIVIDVVALSTATVACLLLAIQHFERRHFYKIIQEQKKKIEQLEEELRDKH
jgi:hypothetical protein